MSFDYQDCRMLLLNAIHETLEAKAHYITSIERTAYGDLPVTGLSLDIFPWRGRCDLSIRISSDLAHYNSADWQHVEFASSSRDNIAALREAALYISKAYTQTESQIPNARDVAHLVFMAGAEALLNESVADQLQSLGINAPTTFHKLREPHFFEYMVFDEDGTIHANYCEIVNAIRATEWLLQGRYATQANPKLSWSEK